ncbi:hypothetical protein ACL02U_19980 [Streptomyces sp. MS06]|uniref:hypothetical protein n=1 Tax=Streptomyces sp. MS06 TaxID=3385974 RepID=UPI0039A2D207
MLPSTSPPDTGSLRDAPDIGCLLAAARRLAGTLPAARARLGVVPGRHRVDRERAWTLRTRLAEHGVDSEELSAIPEGGEPGGPPRGRPGPAVGLLVHAGASRPEPAMRAAAMWQVPLLLASPDGPAVGRPGTAGEQRRDVIGIHLADRSFDIALREVRLLSLRADPGRARLILDNEKITTPGGRPLRVRVTGQGLLEVCGDTFGTRRVRRLRLERAWGAHRLDMDGTSTREVRTPLRLGVEPGRLHLLHP